MKDNIDDTSAGTRYINEQMRRLLWDSYNHPDWLYG